MIGNRRNIAQTTRFPIDLRLILDTDAEWSDVFTRLRSNLQAREDVGGQHVAARRGSASRSVFGTDNDSAARMGVLAQITKML